MTEPLEDRLRRVLSSTAMQQVPESTPVPPLRTANSPELRGGRIRKSHRLRPWLAPAITGVAAAVIAVIATVIVVKHSDSPPPSATPATTASLSVHSVPPVGITTKAGPASPIRSSATANASAVVPDLTALSPEAARSAVTALGLKLATTPTVSVDAQKNTVLGQRPRAGTTVRAGSVVTVSIGNGPDFTRVPTDLVGKPFDQAAQELKAAKLGVLQQITKSVLPRGQVLALAGVPAGATVQSGTPVTLSVSDNSLFTVPNLANLSLDNAASALRAAGWSGTSAADFTVYDVPSTDATVIGRIASGPQRVAGSGSTAAVERPGQDPAIGQMADKAVRFSFAVYTKKQIVLPAFRAGVTTVDQISAAFQNLGATNVRLVLQTPANPPVVPFTFISMTPGVSGAPVDFDAQIIVTTWGAAPPR